MGVTVDTHAEGEPTVSFRIVVDKAVEDGVHHPGAHHLDPTGLFADPAALALAERTGDIDFRAGLGEREEARSEARFGLFTKKLVVEDLERAFQVRERDPFIDNQSFDLMKHRRVRRVQVIMSEDAPRTDDADWGLLPFHGSNLNGRCVCSQDNVIGDIERVRRIPRRMPGGDVQGLEVVIGSLDFRAVFDRVPHRDENPFHLAPYECDRMSMANPWSRTGQRDVESFPFDLALAFPRP